MPWFRENRFYFYVIILLVYLGVAIALIITQHLFLSRKARYSEAIKVCDEMETIDNNGPAGIARTIRNEKITDIIGHYVTFAIKVPLGLPRRDFDFNVERTCE